MLTFDPKWDINAAFTVLGFALAWWTFKRQGERAHKDRRNETYQKLELASIELFRFEAGNPDLVLMLQSEEELPAKGTREFVQLHAYLCQIMNLFEMAIRLNKDGVMDNVVFATWVPWFWATGQHPRVGSLWKSGVRQHYAKALRDIMEQATKPAPKTDPGGWRFAFHDFLNRVCDPKVLADRARDEKGQ